MRCILPNGKYIEQMILFLFFLQNIGHLCDVVDKQQKYND